MYLSIDVGIKNLAYVVYDTDIVEWKVIELCDKSQNASKLNMIEVGKKLFDALETIKHPIETIIIENQIGQNAIRMKMLQGMITLYYISKGMHQIHYWNAGNKLKQFIKTKTTYSQRKKASVHITREIIKNAYPSQDSYFETHKKKDDLADCLLQLLDFLRKQDKLPDSINLICNAINLKL
jgi:hypothetical protein